MLRWKGLGPLQMVWCDKDIAPSCVMLKLPEEEQLLAGSCLIGISAAALACSDMSSSFLAMSSIAMWSCALTSSVLACTHGPLSFSEGRSFMTSPAQCCQQGDFSFPAGFFCACVKQEPHHLHHSVTVTALCSSPALSSLTLISA